MASIFGFFKRKPRADAPAATPSDEARSRRRRPRQPLCTAPPVSGYSRRSRPSTSTAAPPAPDAIAVRSAAETFTAAPPAPESVAISPTAATDIAPRPAAEPTVAPPTAETDIATRPPSESMDLGPLTDVAPPSMHPVSAAAVAMPSPVDISGDPAGDSDRCNGRTPVQQLVLAAEERSRQDAPAARGASRRSLRRRPQARRSVLRRARNRSAELRRGRLGHRIPARQSARARPAGRLHRSGATERSAGRLLLDLLSPLAKPLDVSTHRPFVIMLAGVNGSGKTTSIGKLAQLLQAQGKKVLLAAGDTFRAAAREQLIDLGRAQRRGRGHASSRRRCREPSSSMPCNAASARGIDIVLADTAGRLPTQLHLMDEIEKVKRVVGEGIAGRAARGAAGAGRQHRPERHRPGESVRRRARGTGLIMTKLDGTAKGGVIAAIAHTRSKANRGTADSAALHRRRGGHRRPAAVRRGGFRRRAARVTTKRR